jgi:hypothetical protein
MFFRPLQTVRRASTMRELRLPSQSTVSLPVWDGMRLSRLVVISRSCISGGIGGLFVQDWAIRDFGRRAPRCHGWRY